MSFEKDIKKGSGNYVSPYPQTPEGTKKAQKIALGALRDFTPATKISPELNNNLDFQKVLDLLKNNQISPRTYSILVELIEKNGKLPLDDNGQLDLGDYANEIPIRDKEVLEKVFNNSKQNGTKEEENSLKGKDIEEANTEKYKDSPYYQIIKRLDEAHIPSEEINLGVEKLKEAKNDDEAKNIMKGLIGLISDEDLKLSLEKYTNGDIEEVNQDNFKETKFFQDSKTMNLKIDEGFGGLEKMLGENYISIPNKDKSQDVEADLLTCMDIVGSKIIENNDDIFKKNNKDLIKDLREAESIEKKYSLIKDLYEADLKRDAELGGKKIDEERGKIETQKRDLKSEYTKLNNELNEARKSGDLAKLNRLQKEIEAIEMKALKIEEFVGDIKVLSSKAKIDKSPEKNESNNN